MSTAQPFIKSITSTQRRTLIAAALGWMLDAFDAMLYALVLAYVIRDLGMSKSTAGFLQMSLCWPLVSEVCSLGLLPITSDASRH